MKKFKVVERYIMQDIKIVEVNEKDENGDILNQDELEDEALEISYGDDKPEEKYEGTLGIEVIEIKD